MTQVATAVGIDHTVLDMRGVSIPPLREATSSADDYRVPDSADIYDLDNPGLPVRTTKNLALAATLTDDPPTPYVGLERQTASAIGTILILLLNAGMMNHHEYVVPKTRFSVLTGQIVRAYNQLRFGTGKVEELFRDLFRKEFGRDPVDVIDIRGGAKRLHDADFLVRVVRKFSPWPETADDLERRVFDEDRQISEKFDTFFTTVLQPQMTGSVLAYGHHPKKEDATNKAVLICEQEGRIVKLTFRPRWGLKRGSVVFVGDIGDRCGETFNMESSTLPVEKVLAALHSFNFRGEGMAVELDARKRALKAGGFKFVIDGKSGVEKLIA